MSDIKCQAKHEGSGCMTCGGYGFVLQVRKCPTCAHESLVRPGCYTSWDGKQWRSFDGVEITDYASKPATCSYCEGGK